MDLKNLNKSEDVQIKGPIERVFILLYIFSIVNGQKYQDFHFLDLSFILFLPPLINVKFAQILRFFKDKKMKMKQTA